MTELDAALRAYQYPLSLAYQRAERQRVSEQERLQSIAADEEHVPVAAQMLLLLSAANAVEANSEQLTPLTLLPLPQSSVDQIKKSFCNEPLHIAAAFEVVDWDGNRWKRILLSDSQKFLHVPRAMRPLMPQFVARSYVEVFFCDQPEEGSDRAPAPADAARTGRLHSFFYTYEDLRKRRGEMRGLATVFETTAYEPSYAPRASRPVHLILGPASVLGEAGYNLSQDIGIAEAHDSLFRALQDGLTPALRETALRVRF